MDLSYIYGFRHIHGGEPAGPAVLAVMEQGQTGQVFGAGNRRFAMENSGAADGINRWRRQLFDPAAACCRHSIADRNVDLTRDILLLRLYFDNMNLYLRVMDLELVDMLNRPACSRRLGAADDENTGQAVRIQVQSAIDYTVEPLPHRG